MHISKLDIKSMSVFAVVMRTHSLSAAADQLDMTQPAVSQTVSRLRTHFGDQLFVRTREGMQPTARAVELLEPIEEVLKIVRERVDARQTFDPSTARRVFTLVSTDFGATILLPKLTAELRRVAPSIRVRSKPANSALMSSQLESGEVDLAFGAFSDLVAGYHQRLVFSENYACIAGPQFKFSGEGLTQQEFLNASHAIVTPLPGGYESVEQLIRREVPSARIVLEVPNFLALLFLMREFDLLCTVPKRVGVALAEFAGLAVYPLPFSLPPLEIRQFWHERMHNDPAHRWFRNLLNQLFGATDSH